MKGLRIAILVGMLAAASLGAAGGVAAANNGVLAQVEVSANCDNPSYPLCDPTTGFGLGGIWLWVEIDSNSTAVVAGADCGHTQGGPRGGAGPVHGTFPWWPSAGPEGFPFFATDPNGNYYNVNLGSMGVFAFPQTQGHYAFHPVPGVSINVTVAP